MLITKYESSKQKKKEEIKKSQINFHNVSNNTNSHLVLSQNSLENPTSLEHTMNPHFSSDNKRKEKDSSKQPSAKQNTNNLNQNPLIPYKRLSCHINKNNPKGKSNTTMGSKTQINTSKKSLNLHTENTNKKDSFTNLNKHVNMNELRHINKIYETTKNSPVKSIKRLDSFGKLNHNTYNTGPKTTKVSYSSLPSDKIHMHLEFLESFFSELDKYNLEHHGNLKANYNSLFQLHKIFEVVDNLNKNKNEGYTKYSIVWKTFLTNIDAISCKNNFINNINLSTKNVINNNKEQVTSNEHKLDELKNDYKKLKSQMKEEIKDIKNKLKEKDKEIKEMNNTLEGKDKYIKDLEIVINDMNKKVSQSQEANNDNENNELHFYSHKQLLRDYNMLNSENKNLREVNNKLESEINMRKEKEIKIMKLLYYLNKKGIAIDEILENEINDDEKTFDDALATEQSIIFSDSKLMNKSVDSSMYLPLSLEPIKKSSIKPERVPNLNLTDINSKYNSDYLSPTGKKPNPKVNIINVHSPLNKVNLNPLELELFKTYKNINQNNSENPSLVYNKFNFLEYTY